MCGIYGFSSIPTNGFDQDELNTVLNLAAITEFRGRDSTGLCMIRNNFTTETIKSVGGFSSLFTKERWDTTIRPLLFKEGLAVIGHGRAATRGTVNLENAHPFVVEREDKSAITLVHNGTLSWSQPFEGMHKHSVDSSWLAHLIAELGPEEVLPRINGALALIWFDSKDNTMNFFRNDERPLSVAIAKGAYYVASEEAALAFAKAKCGLGFKYNDILSFKPYHHVCLPMKDVRNLKSIDDLPFTEMKRIYAAPVGFVSAAADYLGEGEEPYYGSRWRERFTGQSKLPLPDYSKYSKAGNSYSFLSYAVVDRDKRITSEVREALSYRGMQQDIFRIHLGEMVSVYFTATGRVTTFRTYAGDTPNGSYTTFDGGVTPYEFGLEKLDAGVNGAVIKHYTAPNDTTQWMDKEQVAAEFTKYIDKIKAEKWNKVLNPEPPKDNVILMPTNEDHEPYLSQKMGPNQTVKFHTKCGTITLKHKGKRTPSREHKTFVEYENNQDGKFKIGDSILVEVDDVEVVKNKAGQATKTLKVTATRALGAQDSAIDYFFFVSNLSSEEVVEFGVFDCKIAGMRVATKLENRKTGAIMVFMLADPVPATWDNGKKKDALH